MCEAADDGLFASVLYNGNHVLAQLLPPIKETPYQLRPRAHNRSLPIADTLLRKNFIERMLYKDSYWSSLISLLKVLSDVYAAADRRKVTILAMLDLSAAFDCVDHRILSERLRQSYGIRDRALDWFVSYLSGRSQQVRFNGQTSASVFLTCGVPQGSVLGPILFLLYTADAIAIIRKHGLHAHAYADDLQLYDHSEPGSAALLIPRLSACVMEIEQWMSSNRLRLNPSKTELIWLGSEHNLKECSSEPQLIANAWITPSPCVRDLGVMVDNEMTMTSHISHLTSVCYYHIRQLRAVRRSLTTETAHALVRALVNSRLDYCNGVLAGQPRYSYDKLQSVLRAAARLVLRLPGSASVKSLMRTKLHWLPFPDRIDYKLSTLAYKCRHGCAPAYLSNMCTPVANIPSRSHLRSAAEGNLTVPRTYTATFGPRGFSVSCPSAWNALPSEIKDDKLSIGSFKNLLKTHYFSKSG